MRADGAMLSILPPVVVERERMPSRSLPGFPAERGWRGRLELNPVERDILGPKFAGRTEGEEMGPRGRDDETALGNTDRRDEEVGGRAILEASGLSIHHVTDSARDHEGVAIVGERSHGAGLDDVTRAENACPGGRRRRLETDPNARPHGVKPTLWNGARDGWMTEKLNLHKSSLSA